MIATVTPAEVRFDLIARREVAILDLREENPYSKDHPLFAASLSLSQLELEILDRVPRKDVKLVLYDNGEGLVEAAAERLTAMGYSQVVALEGGLKGWQAAGYQTFQDVNSASKAFGEMVEGRRHTPSLPAPEAKALIESEPNLVVLDVRRFEEYQTMSIPKGMSVPGAELVMRARQIAPDPTTTIIVNCAGRTRSIIGAQSLVNAGVPNPVFALRNGTIGWTLAGQTLDKGQQRRFPEAAAGFEQDAVLAAQAVSYRAGVRRLTPGELAQLAKDGARTLYRFDVRTPEEFAAGHIAGFRCAPGGQLVQETDVFAPVRGGRIVLADDRGPRADMTASWLAQMGWEVYVLDGGFDGDLQKGPWQAALPALPKTRALTAAALAEGLAAQAFTVVDLALSPAHRRGHIPGAWYAIRAQLAAAAPVIGQASPWVLTSPDGVAATLAAADVEALTGSAPLVLEGGTDAWIKAGLPVETGLEKTAVPPDDVYRRPYEGTDNAAEAMQAYLDWEYGLVEQLRLDGSHGFYVI